MAHTEVAIPTLPARDLEQTLEFYGQIGFETVFRVPDPEGYAIVRRGPIELHFFLWPELDPAATYTGCYIRVPDVDALYETFAAARLPARGVPCLGGIERKFYGMREFRLVDPNGNLLRVGEPVKARSSRRTPARM